MNGKIKLFVATLLSIIIVAVFICPVHAEGQKLEFGVSTSGNFTVYGEVHSYYFDGNAGDTILLTLTWGGSGNTWASFDLYSPNGVMLNSSQGPTAKASNKLPVTGRYTISAGTTGPAWGKWGPGPYILTVQRVAFGSPSSASVTGTPAPKPIHGISETSPGQVQIPASSETRQDSIPLFLILGVVIGAAVLAGVGIFHYMEKKRSLKPRTEKSQTPSGAREPVRGASPGQGTIEHDVFISYASADKPVADAICNSLESQKIRCWVAPRDILPGMNFQESIIDAIDSSSIMVLVFSSHSNSSPHVITEATEAMAKGVIIIPFRIEDVIPSKAMKYLISVPHWLDAMTPPLEQHIVELSHTIQVILNQKKSNEQREE